VVNNSTNINKINKQLSPQIIEHLKKKEEKRRTMTYNVGNQGPGFRQTQKYDRHFFLN
jgi:hypothetical protein